MKVKAEFLAMEDAILHRPIILTLTRKASAAAKLSNLNIPSI